MQQTVESLRIGVLPGVDPDPTNIVGAATFNCDTPTVVLLRLEKSQDQSMCRLTVRCNETTAAESVRIILEQRLGFSEDRGSNSAIHLSI
jgi:hypothetical protein